MDGFVSEERKCSYRKQFKDKDVSEFALVVIDILSRIYDGIHNVPYRYSLIERTDWSHEDYVVMSICTYDLNTYDDNRLTKLVVLCHDNAVRLSLSPLNPFYLKMTFSRRTREGDIYHRHPTMEEAITIVRENKRNV